MAEVPAVRGAKKNEKQNKCAGQGWRRCMQLKVKRKIKKTK
jgi:hypothetical protein